jgi:hypothetical protein
MNNLQLAIVYKKTEAVALGFLSSMSHLSPRRHIGMTDSEEPTRGYGCPGGGPV